MHRPSTEIGWRILRRGTRLLGTISVIDKRRSTSALAGSSEDSDSSIELAIAASSSKRARSAASAMAAISSLSGLGLGAPTVFGTVAAAVDDAAAAGGVIADAGGASCSGATAADRAACRDLISSTICRQTRSQFQQRTESVSNCSNRTCNQPKHHGRNHQTH